MKTTAQGRASARQRAVAAETNDGFHLKASWIVDLIDDFRELEAQRPPASELSKQWRELAEEQLERWGDGSDANNLAHALIAAADACDRLEDEAKSLEQGWAKVLNENIKLRELLATARNRLASMQCTCSRKDDWGWPIPQDGHRQSCDYGRANETVAAIDTALKTS